MLKLITCHKIWIFIFAWLVFFSFSTITSASSLPYQLRGSFLIQADAQGQAWYVDMENGLRHELNKNSAWSTISSLGIGVSSTDLKKIPIGVNNKLTNHDADGDGLDDDLERAIGTNPNNPDSDNDSYQDAVEILNHYDPLGPDRLPIDKKLVSKLAGQILLDVNRNGEAWYLNPKDGLRYYIAGQTELFQLISLLGQGINTINLNSITNALLIADNQKKSIKVDTGTNQLLHYYLGGVEIGSFLISSGTYSMPTPKGEFKIINKHIKPWSSYGLWMPYWLGLGNGGFGFHELPIWPNGYREGENHLGKRVSHGCIRLGIGPAEFLYNWVEIGTPVFIY